MAKLDGGIFSRPRGTTAGVVFGAARTRTGKVATARQLVPPSNPNTPAQQTQRSRFKVAQNTVRRWGPAIYQTDFNRSVSQLPGFQSMQSILTKAVGDDLIYTAPPPTRLGTMPALPMLSFDAGALDPGEIVIGHSIAELPDGYEDDTPINYIWMKADQTQEESGTKGGDGNKEFSQALFSITDLEPDTDYLVGVYAVGIGPSQGNYNTVQWAIVRSHA